MKTLRPDQLQLKADIFQGWNSGARNMLAVLPTGGGKSVVLSDIVAEKLRLGRRQAIVAHRNELVSQLSGHLASYGISHRLVAPAEMVSMIVAQHREEYGGKSFVNQSAPTAVGGIDTILSRQNDLTEWAKQITDWTLDEAHHGLAENKWGRGLSMFVNAIGLGVTATPSRADGKGLGAHNDGLFHAMALGPTMRQLIDLGALTDYEFALPESDFSIEDDAITDSGDYSPRKMREASKRSHITGDVVKEYVKHALGKRAICFATDVETAVEIAGNFKAWGIAAEAISAKTPAHVRNEMIKRFRRGEVTILVNVDLFGEGFDVPACEVVIMARPTASLGVYLQQIGRGLRVILGKRVGLIIDHVGNWKRHGFPDKPHKWSLERREKRAKKKPDPEDIELTRCLNAPCGKPYVRALPKCPHCGFAPVAATGGGRGSPEQVDGDLILLDRDTLSKMRAETQLDSPADVGNRTKFVAGDLAAAGAVNRQIEKINAQTRLKDAIAQWAGIQRARGRSDQESYRRFYLATGVDVLTALGKDRGRADFEQMAELVEGWNKQL